jgi:hypothetical protein
VSIVSIAVSIALAIVGHSADVGRHGRFEGKHFNPGQTFRVVYVSTLFRQEAVEAKRDPCFGRVQITQSLPANLVIVAGVLLLAISIGYAIVGHYTRRVNATGLILPREHVTGELFDQQDDQRWLVGGVLAARRPPNSGETHRPTAR